MKAWCRVGSLAPSRGSISVPPPMKRSPSWNLASKYLMLLVDHKQVLNRSSLCL